MGGRGPVRLWGRDLGQGYELDCDPPPKISAHFVAPTHLQEHGPQKHIGQEAFTQVRPARIDACASRPRSLPSPLGEGTISGSL